MKSASSLIKHLSEKTLTAKGELKMSTRSLLVIAILLHAIACVCADISIDSSDIALRDDTGNVGGSEERVPSFVVPSSLTNNNNNNNNYLSQNRLSAKERLLTVPKSFARYFFPNMQVRVPLVDQTQASLPASSFKRSTSALDSLTGITLPGKRSVASQLINFEPLLDKHSALFVRTRPRLYDMEQVWTGGVFVPYESQAKAQLDYSN